jgi:hypothetical protein
VTEHGLHDATTDEPTIRNWFTRWPGAMIGCRTGPESGVFVIDLDVDATKNIDGVAGFATLCEGKEAVPETFTTRTPRGGKHLYFVFCNGVKNSASKIAVGVDVRGEGGYSILPPSRRSDGKYYKTLAAGEPCEAPRWLIDLVVKQDPPHLAQPGPTLDAFARAAASHRRNSNGSGAGRAGQARHHPVNAIVCSIAGSRM